MFALLGRALIAGDHRRALAGLVGLAVGEQALQHAINFEETGSTAAAPRPSDPAGGDDHAGSAHDHGAASLRPRTTDGAASDDHHAAQAVTTTAARRAREPPLAARRARARDHPLRRRDRPAARALYAFRRARRPGGSLDRRALASALPRCAGVDRVPLILTPPNPPGIGDPGDDQRTHLRYLGAVAGGLAIAWLASRLVRELPAGRPRWQPVAAVAGIAAAGLVLLCSSFPSPATPPQGLSPPICCGAFGSRRWPYRARCGRCSRWPSPRWWIAARAEPAPATRGRTGDA